MMLIHTCARGVWGVLRRNFFEKKKWCDLVHSECSKVSYYQTKINMFWIINQQPKFCAIFFSKINPDAHFGTKIDTFTFYKGVWGAKAPRSQRNVKSCRHQILVLYYIPDA